MTATNAKKPHLLIITSIVPRWTHLEWVCEGLDRSRFELSFLLLALTERRPFLEGYLAQKGIPFRTLRCRITPVGIVKTIAEIRRYCREHYIDIVHTHIFYASLVGLLGAFFARVPVRLNTRHHAVPNHGTAKSVLDQLANRLATRTIVTCELLRHVVVDLEGLANERVRLVRLGIDLERFRQIPAEQVEEMRRRYNPDGASPLIGVVARHIESKGIQYIIPAFQRLLATYPGAHLLLAYAVGPYRPAIEAQLSGLPSERYTLISFEENVFALYKIFDLCVQVPVGEDQESFGLIYLEALAAGVPCIFTLSGVAREFLVHGRNAWVVRHRNSEEIYEGMIELLANPTLRQQLSAEGWLSVRDAFSHQRMVAELEALYVDELAMRSGDAEKESRHAE